MEKLKTVQVAGKSLSCECWAYGNVARNAVWADGNHILVTHPSYKDSHDHRMPFPATCFAVDDARTHSPPNPIVRTIIASGETVYAIRPDGTEAAIRRLVRSDGPTRWAVDLLGQQGQRSLHLGKPIGWCPSAMEYSRNGSCLLVSSLYDTDILPQGQRLTTISHLAENFGFGLDESARVIYNPLVSHANITKELQEAGRRDGVIERFRFAGTIYPKPEPWVEQPGVRTASLHPSGRWLAAYGDGKLRAWEVPSAKSLGEVAVDGFNKGNKRYEVYDCVGMDFNHAGDLLVVSDASRLHVCRVFDGGIGEALGSFWIGAASGANLRVRFSGTKNICLIYSNCGIHGGNAVTIDFSPLIQSAQ